METTRALIRESKHRERAKIFNADGSQEAAKLSAGL